MMFASANNEPVLDAKVIYCLVFLGLALAASIFSVASRRSLLWWLQVETVIVGVAILYLSYVVFMPEIPSPKTVAEAPVRVELPDYDTSPWKELPLQEGGRIKPFETAAREAMRQITGREKFEGHSSVAVVLQWMLLPNGAPGDCFTDWEHKDFILCDHLDLRKAIYTDLNVPNQELKPEQTSGKYVSPSDLRKSKGLQKLLESAQAKRDSDREKASQLMTPEERKAEEVVGRLVEFDAISRYDAGNPRENLRHRDPFHFVSLDHVASGPWFALGELQEISKEKLHDNNDTPALWLSLMYDRLSRTPQLYIAKNSEHTLALEQFQEQLKAKTGSQAIEELAKILRARDERLLQEFADSRLKDDRTRTMELFVEIVKTPQEKKRIFEMMNKAREKSDEMGEASLLAEMRSFLAERSKKTIEDLDARVATAQISGYRPDKTEFRVLHFDYLEALFPDLYKKSLAAQAFPRSEIEKVLASHTRLKEAYRSKDSEKFAAASQDFFATLKDVSELYVKPYPGEDTLSVRLAGLVSGRPTANPSPELIHLETTFDRVAPFMVAWILMLFSVLCFTASLALDSKIAYYLGFFGYLVSLGYQIFGFTIRIAISGRPPVSNMYETVIWVAFMSAIFALILEMTYRRTVIALAGSMVATLGLVLADQLPLALDPKISPIVPVLRSTYWLTIHVLTIVSSYAGGTLAWGLGNISLALLAFGKPKKDLLKSLSQFTYGAVKIAVILLGAGTFLGGWWAVESWGRFWGWDPKEVWALIALVCYVIPLHARNVGWVKDFGLAVSAVLCYAAIVMSWYGVNFVLAAGLHSYGFGGGGPWLVFWAGLINIEWVLIASRIYLGRLAQPVEVVPKPEVAALEAVPV